MMNTKEHDEHMHKKMHELLEHYNRKSVSHKINTFQVKSAKQLEKEIQLR